MISALSAWGARARGGYFSSQVLASPVAPRGLEFGGPSLRRRRMTSPCGMSQLIRGVSQWAAATFASVCQAGQRGHFAVCAINLRIFCAVPSPAPSLAPHKSFTLPARPPYLCRLALFAEARPGAAVPHETSTLPARPPYFGGQFGYYSPVHPSPSRRLHNSISGCLRLLREIRNFFKSHLRFPPSAPGGVLF